MLRPLYRVRLGHIAALACLVAWGCLDQGGPERYILNIALPKTVDDSDYVVIVLADTSGSILDSIYRGRPDSRRVRREAPHYGGGEAIVYVQEYRSPSAGGDSAPIAEADIPRLGRLAVETPIRINAKQGRNETQEPTGPPEVSHPEPADSSELSPGDLVLRWRDRRFIDPQPVYEVRYGTTSRMDLVRRAGTLREAEAPPPEEGARHYWRVVSTRAGNRVEGPVWTFRVRTPAPSLLRYPAPDSVLWRDSAFRLVPEFAGGAGLRFSIAPPLPAGLAIDSLLGVIAGTPSGEAPRAEYTVTLRNAAGSRQAVLAFRVGLTANRVARWQADEGAGNVLSDSAGGGHHGVVEGATWAQGVRGGSLSFGGAEWARIPVAGALAVKGFTLSLWSRQAAQTKTDPLLEYSEAGGLLGVHIQANTHGNAQVVPGALYCNIRPTDAHPSQHGSVRERNLLFTAGGVAPPGRWNHIAVTFDPKTWKARIYVNGREEASKDLQPDFVPLARGRIHLGYRPDDLIENDVGNGFSGSLDEVEIYDGPLDSAAIGEKYRELFP